MSREGLVWFKYCGLTLQHGNQIIQNTIVQVSYVSFELDIPQSKAGMSFALTLTTSML